MNGIDVLGHTSVIMYEKTILNNNMLTLSLRREWHKNHLLSDETMWNVNKSVPQVEVCVSIIRCVIQQDKQSILYR